MLTLHTFPQTDFLQLWEPDAHATREEILHGLQAPQATIPPKYFYDRLGSRLFEAICDLPEYYPTRTEIAILDSFRSQIGASVGTGSTMIDLGAGNCAKAARLFSSLQPRHYVPVDISVDFLRDAVEQLRQRFPHIRMTGIGIDFAQRLILPDNVPHERRLFFYPGSSIGNFEPQHALQLLRDMRSACGDDPHGGLLIGVDLVKERHVLESAYDDALGVTAAFNLNLLSHLNALAGTDFRIADWCHRAVFNEAKSRIEMHLVARRDITVRWDDDEDRGQRRFAEGDTIHTESSYKYGREAFLAMLAQAGFAPVRTWTDERGWFMVCHARAA